MTRRANAVHIEDMMAETGLTEPEIRESIAELISRGYLRLISPPSLTEECYEVIPPPGLLLPLRPPHAN